ncbi:MAG: bifunctional adenosylcobinamide kinase/adenosylcobinamide-phosphate guanylyltransferase [Vicinamibacteria bacterium]
MLTLILGGARSGKSRYAGSLCDGEDAVVFIATAPPTDAEHDPEMASRISRHRAERPAHWVTIEATLDVAAAVRSAEPSGSVVLVDCVTLWLSNLLYQHRGLARDAREARILEDVGALAEAAHDRRVIAVSNEVGEGIVPETPLSREFRDLQGQANQMLARSASRVVLLVAGIPLSLKA